MPAKIPVLYKNQQEYFVLVDEEDLQRVLSNGPWRLRICENNTSIVVYRSKDSTNSYWLLHRFILNVTDSSVLVYHADNNSLNNCKKNLIKTSRSHSSLDRNRISRKNRTGFVGIRFELASARYHASIKYKNKEIYLGAFKEKSKAVTIRKLALAQLLKAEVEQKDLESVMKDIRFLKKMSKGKIKTKNKKKVATEEKSTLAARKTLSLADLL